MNFSDENAVLNERSALMRVYDGIKHTDISEEFILPDYLPDVKRIIRVDVKPKIDGKFISAGRVDYEGDVVCHILFCDEGNHLKSVIFTAAFSDGIDLSGIEDECVANLIPSPESITCKMLNPRRVSVRMRLDTSVTIWCNKSFTPEYIGEYGEIESAERNIEVMKLVCAGESGLSVSSDLEADGALPQINEIISCNVDISFYECKASDGKVLCRGDMPITVFYSSIDGDSESYTVLFRKLPVAQVVIAEDVSDECSCMARGAIDSVKYNISENGFGEKRIVELDVTYRIYLNCVEKTSVTVVNDVYASKKNVKCTTEKETFCRFSKLYSTSFGANLAISREELNLSDAENVFALSSTPKITSITQNDDKTRLIVEGTAHTGAVIKSADGLETHEFDVPFKTELDGNGIGTEFTYNYDIVCVSSKGRFDNDMLYTELDMQLNLMILETECTEILKKAEFSDKAPDDDRPQMRFYYPSDGETLWDIGKMFGISVSELTDKNDIVGDTVPSVLYIPFVK